MVERVISERIVHSRDARAGGHATLTNRNLRITGLGRRGHELVLPLNDVCELNVLPGAAARVVEVHFEDRVVRLRCFGATRFADQIIKAAIG